MNGVSMDLGSPSAPYLSAPPEQFSAQSLPTYTKNSEVYSPEPLRVKSQKLITKYPTDGYAEIRSRSREITSAVAYEDTPRTAQITSYSIVPHTKDFEALVLNPTDLSKHEEEMLGTTIRVLDPKKEGIHHRSPSKPSPKCNFLHKQTGTGNIAFEDDSAVITFPTDPDDPIPLKNLLRLITDHIPKTFCCAVAFPRCKNLVLSIEKTTVDRMPLLDTMKADLALEGPGKSAPFAPPSSELGLVALLMILEGSVSAEFVMSLPHLPKLPGDVMWMASFLGCKVVEEAIKGHMASSLSNLMKGDLRAVMKTTQMLRELPDSTLDRVMQIAADEQVLPPESIIPRVLDLNSDIITSYLRCCGSKLDLRAVQLSSVRAARLLGSLPFATNLETLHLHVPGSKPDELMSILMSLYETLPKMPYLETLGLHGLSLEEGASDVVAKMLVAMKSTLSGLCISFQESWVSDYKKFVYREKVSAVEPLLSSLGDMQMLEKVVVKQWKEVVIDELGNFGRDVVDSISHLKVLGLGRQESMPHVRPSTPEATEGAIDTVLLPPKIPRYRGSPKGESANRRSST